MVAVVVVVAVANRHSDSESNSSHVGSSMFEPHGRNFLKIKLLQVFPKYRPAHPPQITVQVGMTYRINAHVLLFDI